jgi:nitronate monooxygenase
MPGAEAAAMMAGSIHDLPTVKELIDRIVADANAMYRSRLERFFGAVASVAQGSREVLGGRWLKI